MCDNVLIFHIGEVALMYNRKRMLYSILPLGTTIKNCLLKNESQALVIIVQKLIPQSMII